MNINARNSIILCTMVLTLSACSPMNSLTIGKNNMMGIELAVDCKRDEAVQSLEKAMSSDIAGYRRMSYVITAAIYSELGKVEKYEEITQKFKNDPVMSDKDKDDKAYLTDVECFEDYLKKERLEKIGNNTCT